MRGKEIAYGMRRLKVNSLLSTDIILLDVDLTRKEIPQILVGKNLNVRVRKTDVDKSTILPKGFRLYDCEVPHLDANFNVFITLHSGFKDGLDIQLDSRG